MATRRKHTSPPKTRRRRAAVTKPRQRARAHLLIIECDSAKLAADGLNLGTAFGDLLKRIFPEKRIAIVPTSTEAKLGEDLALTYEAHGRFRSVLIVGHSNEAGLALTSDNLRGWSAVGKWLEKFEPEFCFLAACCAGRSEAVRGLFAPVKTLRQIYASPSTLHKNQLSPLAVIIGMLLKDGRIDEDRSGGLRLVNYALTGGQLYRWKREEVGAGEEVKARFLDSLAALLDRGSWDLREILFPIAGQSNDIHPPL